MGEILVKYHPNANNDVVNIIESEGGEAVVLDLTDFLLYGMYSKQFNYAGAVRKLRADDGKQSCDLCHRAFQEAYEESSRGEQKVP